MRCYLSKKPGMAVLSLTRPGVLASFLPSTLVMGRRLLGVVGVRGALLSALAASAVVGKISKDLCHA